jgi:hypothetical protein
VAIGAREGRSGLLTFVLVGAAARLDADVFSRY